MSDYLDVITTIENELGILYVGGAINFIDDHYDNAWSKAMDRFDHSLTEAIRTKDDTKASMEAKIYKISIQAFIEQYKKHQHQERVKLFLGEK